MPAVPTLVTYVPKAGHDDALISLVRAHYPALRELGLASDKPPQLFRAWDKRTGASSIVEIFEWATEESSEIAHHTPEVMAVWESMGAHIESMTLLKIEAIEPG